MVMADLSRRTAMLSALAAACCVVGPDPVTAPTTGGQVAVIDAFNELCVSGDGRSIGLVPMLDSLNELMIVDGDVSRAQVWTYPGQPVLIQGLRLDRSGRRLTFCAVPLALRGGTGQLAMLDLATGVLTRFDPGVAWPSAPVLDEENDRILYFGQTLDGGLRCWPYALSLEGGPPRRLDDVPLQMVTRSMLWNDRLVCAAVPDLSGVERLRHEEATAFRRLEVVGGALEPLAGHLAALSAARQQIHSLDVRHDGTLLCAAVDLDTQRRRFLAIGNDIRVLSEHAPAEAGMAACARHVDRMVMAHITSHDGEFDAAKHISVEG